MEKILILAEARTGSHRLFQLIRQYLIMQGYNKISLHEYFNKYNPKYEMSFQERFDYFMDEKNSDEFIVTKIIADQLIDYSIEQRQQIVDKFDKVVILNRFDLFDQYLSYVIALALDGQGIKRWYANTEFQIDNVTITKSVAYSFFKHKELSRQVFADLKIKDFKTLEYERLTEMSPAELLTFVDIDCDIPDQTVKLDTQAQKPHIITNFSEVQDWFINFANSQFEVQYYDDTDR